MAAGRIYHWKHGWIPLTAAALRYKAGDGPRPTSKTPAGTMTNAERRKLVNAIRKEKGLSPIPPRGRVPQTGHLTDAEIDARVEKSAAEMRAARYKKTTKVDGVEFVTYKSSALDPLGDDHGNPAEFTPHQMQVMAEAYNAVKAEFPTMEPVQIVGVDGKTGAFGITAWDGRRISMSTDVFNDARREEAAEKWGLVGAIAGQYVDHPDAFARAVVTHELGHALQMQNRQAHAATRKIAYERVTADDVGIKIKPEDDIAGLAGIKPSERKLMRWEVDTLDGQSAYATGNEFEWVAEAFAEGWFNQGGATDSGKRVLAAMREAYGQKGAVAA